MSTIFQPPKFGWIAKVNGLHVSPGTILDTGTEVYIECTTMCGKEKAEGEFIIQKRMGVEEAVRRAQFASSIQHVTRRACEGCLNMYQKGTNSHEKQYLTTTHPELGPIIGLDSRGAYGAPLGAINPEEIGNTDQSALDTFQKDQADNQAMMKDKMDEIRNQSGKA